MKGRFRSKGYSVYIDELGQTHETDTFTCRHCQKLVSVPAMAKPEDVGGLCYRCYAPICPSCVEKGGCDPIDEKIRREEASYHARKSYGLI